MLGDIRASGADILLVAFGVPKQEKWIREHLAETGVGFAMGVGGLFDFYSGRIPRAPVWVRELGIEWLYRFAQEPRRMWRRYFVGNFIFLFRAFSREAGSSERADGSYHHGHRPEQRAFHGLDEYLPIPLLPLADRPFLQHVVEFLVRQGVRRFEFILSHLPEKIEARFGDGARWGCSFLYHLVPSADEALRVAAGIASGVDDDVILASGVCLPEFEMAAVDPGSLLIHEDHWTGWARLPRDSRMLREMASGGLESGARYPVPRCLSIESGEAFLSAQRDILSGGFPGLMIGGRQADPQIWISRNVALHPSANIQPPVYIGENCRVGKGAQIGPSAVIGANCIVDAQSTVVNSMVGSGNLHRRSSRTRFGHSGPRTGW